MSERQFSSVVVGSTAALRRVLAVGVADATPPAGAPPNFGGTTGYWISNVNNLRLLGKIGAGFTATVRAWVWSCVTEEWHSLGVYTVTETNPVHNLGLNCWDGIALRCESITGGTLEAWLMAERHKAGFSECNVTS